MGVKDLFLRLKNEKGIIKTAGVCCNEEFKAWVENSLGLDLKQFVAIFSLLEIPTPIELEDLNENSFLCKSSENEYKFDITAIKSSSINLNVVLHDIVSEYTLETLYMFRIKLNQARKILKTEDKGFYFEYNYNAHSDTVTFQTKSYDLDFLKVTISASDEKIKKFFTSEEYINKVEKYFRELKNYNFEVTDVQKKLTTEFMGLSNEECSKIKLIEVGQRFLQNNSIKGFNEIYLYHGVVTHLAVYIEGITYAVSKNGNWRFYTEGVDISFSNGKLNCKISDSIDPNAIMGFVNERIKIVYHEAFEV